MLLCDKKSWTFEVFIACWVWKDVKQERRRKEGGIQLQLNFHQLIYFVYVFGLIVFVLYPSKGERKSQHVSQECMYYIRTNTYEEFNLVTRTMGDCGDWGRTPAAKDIAYIVRKLLSWSIYLILVYCSGKTMVSLGVN